MATAATMPHIITKPTFILADRLALQQKRGNAGEYRRIGRLTTVVLERQLSTKGMSQHTKPIAGLADSMQPFSRWQANAWAQMTLDWLSYKNAPMLAISHDRNDLLLPFALPPLPDIPDPLGISKDSGPVKRIPQDLESRAYGWLKARTGQRFLVFQPITELCVFVGEAGGGFGRIRCVTDPADGTHCALLIDPDSQRGYFVGGSFQAGF